MELVESPKAKKEDICRATYIGGTGIEWICIREIHAKVYQRRSSDRNHRRGAPIFTNAPTADKHFMIPRWISQDLVSTTPSS